MSKCQRYKAIGMTISSTQLYFSLYTQPFAFDTYLRAFPYFGKYIGNNP